MNNKNVVIITGASRGIGAATAQLFAKHGFSVCINYKTNQSAADKITKSIEFLGAEAIAVQADVSEETEVSTLFRKAEDALGPISVVVNNAGIIKPQMRLENMTQERINNILTTNVTGYFLCCKQAVKRMSTKNGGRGGAIVNVSSAASRTGSPNEYIDYAASKGAIDTLTKGLSVEVANEGIRVNGIRPGLIYTDMHADGGEPERVERLKKKLPMQRGGETSEVAEAIYWLASDKSSFVTGSFIDLSGGL